MVGKDMLKCWRTALVLGESEMFNKRACKKCIDTIVAEVTQCNESKDPCTLRRTIDYLVSWAFGLNTDTRAYTPEVCVDIQKAINAFTIDVNERHYMYIEVVRGMLAALSTDFAAQVNKTRLTRKQKEVLAMPAAEFFTLERLKNANEYSRGAVLTSNAITTQCNGNTVEDVVRGGEAELRRLTHIGKDSIALVAHILQKEGIALPS